MTDHTVKRDQWGRPWVSQDGGPLKFEGRRKTPTNAVGYSRVSTLAGTLDDKESLAPWKAATAMIGVVRERSIHAQVASLVSKHRDPWREAKTQMKQLAKRAQEAASSDDGSGLGTSFHEFTEVLDLGRWPEFMPEMFRPFAEAYLEAMQEWEVIGAEPFVVNDELKVAGSMDKLLRHKRFGTIAGGDLKTGASDPFHPLKVEIQVATYVNSERYDQETGKRSPIHPDIDLDHGLLIHVPVRGKASDTALYPLNLERGWEAAKLAVRVRDLRKETSKPLEALV